MKFKLLIMAACGSLLMSAQNNQQAACGTGAPSQQWEDWFGKQVENYVQNRMQNKTAIVNRVIPVVVHVLHYGETEGTFPNIDSNQIKSQFVVMNADFAGTGLNAGNTPSVFAGAVAGNTGISFCRALKNPQNQLLAVAGIMRWDLSTFPGSPPNPNTPTVNIVDYINNIVKPATIYPPDQWLNIYISDKPATTNITGFATYPQGTSLNGLTGGTMATATDDAIWIWTKAFGTVGTLQAPYNKGRTLTHELGHWLGLRHTWGDGNCLPDYCNDTPPTKTANTGCPTFPLHIDNCGVGQSPNGEMFMNYMDMTDDDCKFMFTNDQNIRIQTAMSQCPNRNLLGTHPNMCATLTPGPSYSATASFTLFEKPCVNQGFTPFNTSSASPDPTFVWSSSPPAMFSNPTVANPLVTFQTPGNYTLTLVATNTINSNSYTMAISNVTTCTVKELCLDSVKAIKNVDSLAVYAITQNTNVLGGCPNGIKGYLSGTNCYNDKEFAQYYNPSSYSATPYPQVHSVIVLFDSTGTKGNAASPVTCKIYGGSGNTGPASVMALKTVSLGAITSSSNKTYNYKYLGLPNQLVIRKVIPFRFDFDVPVILNNPANGFFAGVQINEMSPNDSVSIFDDSKFRTPGTGIDKDSSWVLNSLNNWKTLRYYHNTHVKLAIIPQITCSPLKMGIKDNQTEFNSNISIVPNPNNGMFSLVFTLNKQQDVFVRIYNSIGQIITSEQIQNVSSNVIDLDLSDKPEGIYFTEISNGTERVTKKVIISR